MADWLFIGIGVLAAAVAISVAQRRNLARRARSRRDRAWTMHGVLDAILGVAILCAVVAFLVAQFGEIVLHAVIIVSAYGGTCAMLAVPILLFMDLVAPRSARRSTHRRVGACVVCAYDLRGLPARAPCPECGTTRPRGRRKARLVRDAERGRAGAAIACLTSLLAAPILWRPLAIAQETLAWRVIRPRASFEQVLSLAMDQPYRWAPPTASIFYLVAVLISPGLAIAWKRSFWWRLPLLLIASIGLGIAVHVFVFGYIESLEA